MQAERHVYSGPELAGLIQLRAQQPLIKIRLSEDNASEILLVPCGSCVSITAPTGEGKSSFALQACWVHALTAGPAVYVSLELDANEAAARIVGQRLKTGWLAVLTGEIAAKDLDQALDLPRLRVLDREDATLEKLCSVVEGLRTAYRGEPILVVVDYLQILPNGNGLDGDPRIRVASVVEDVRRSTKRLDVATLMISQCSREASTQLHNGNKLGDQTTNAGAESAQIERAAQATLALGGKKAIDDERFSMMLSIGKDRMGPGNRVVPLEFNGRTGVFQVVGAAVAATQATREVRGQQLEQKLIQAAQNHPGLTRSALVNRVGVNKRNGLEAIKRALTAGQLREVQGDRGVGIYIN